MYKLSNASKAKLKGVHPDLVRVVELAITITEQDFSIGEGVRTLATQKLYVKQGKSQTLDSYHLPQKDGLGHAVDLWAYDGGVKWDEKYYYPIMAAMCAAAKELGVEVTSGAFWGLLNDHEPTVPAMKKAVSDYVAARKKLGKKPFLDLVHFQIAR